MKTIENSFWNHHDRHELAQPAPLEGFVSLDWFIKEDVQQTRDSSVKILKVSHLQSLVAMVAMCQLFKHGRLGNALRRLS